MNQIRRILDSPNVIVPGYIAAIALAEIVGVFADSFAGVVCHAILIPLLLNHYVLAEHARYRRILPVLALAPLLRILSLTMPVGQVPQIYWYALIGTPLLIAITLAMRLLGLSSESVSMQLRLWPLQLFIALTGIPLSVIAFLILHPPAISQSDDWQSLAISTAILVIFTGFVEELLFRGLLQRVASELFGRTGIFVSSALFVIMYTGSLSPSYLLFVGLIGILFGWFVRSTGSIWGVVLAHGVLNTGLLLIIPRLVAQKATIASAFDQQVLLIGALLLIGAVSLMVAHVSALTTTECLASQSIIRLLRTRAGLSHTDLAQRTGIPTRIIVEIEYGLCQPQPEHLRSIARVLGVAPQALLSRSVTRQS